MSIHVLQRYERPAWVDWWILDPTDEHDRDLVQRYVHSSSLQFRLVRYIEEGSMSVEVTALKKDDVVMVDGLSEPVTVVGVNVRAGWAKVRFADGDLRNYRVEVLTKAQPASAPVDKERVSKLAVAPINEARRLGTAPASAPIPTRPKTAPRLPVDGDDTPASASAPPLKKGRAAAAANNDCLCGCGTMVAGMFKQGHDAKFKSWMKRLAAGDMELNEVPERARKLMNIKMVEGIPTPTTDYRGNRWTPEV